MNQLNIYVGIRGIGWNVANDSNIIDFGVKKTAVSFDSYYEFKSGNPISKRIVRREKRQARRNLQRRKFQKNKLLYELKKDYGESPDLTLPQKEWLQLRIKAHSKQLSKKELVTVIYTFTKKRGYKSQRGVDEVGASDYLAEIKRHEDALKDYPNLSSYLLSLNSLKNVILRRETYEQEFIQIAKKQGVDIDKYYKLIFFQRPLKKGKVNNCKYEPNKKVTHASNPYYEELRIYRDAWNIKITNNLMEEVEIPKEIREKIIMELLAGSDITKAKVCKYLGLKKSSQYHWLSGRKIEGNFYTKITKRDIDFYQLWQDIRGMSDNEHITNLLQKKYNFNDLEIEQYFNYDIAKKEFSEFSEKAIKRLLPLAKEMKLKEAILKVYGKMERSDNIYLRNLVVEQVYDSTKSLIKAVTAKYNIDKVKIEIEDELKIGNKARKERHKRERLKEAELKDINKIIAENNGDINQYNQRKYILAKEQNFTDPYTLKSISLDKLFTSQYNLDHIIPKSKYFDFSNRNLIVTETSINSDKQRMTAFDFVSKNGNIDAYLEYISESKLSEQKKRLLMTSEKDIPTVFGDRIDYNTRCFLALFNNTELIPNKLINFYAKHWNLNTYDNDDLRHYLEKSMVMTNLSSETIDYINNLRFNSTNKTSAGVYDISLTYTIPDFSNIVPYFPKIKYFRKNGNNIIVRGQLHEETIYGKRKEILGRDLLGKEKVKEYYKIRKPIEALTKSMVKRIIDKPLRELIQSKIDHFGSLEKFKESLTDKPLIFEGNEVKSVSIAVNSSAMTKIPNGYVYATYFGVTKEGEILNIFDAKELLKDDISFADIYQKNNIVEYKGKLYHIFGIGLYGFALRGLYDLTAKDKGLKVPLKRTNELVKIRKNQI